MMGILLVVPTLMLTACTDIKYMTGTIDDVDYYGMQCEKMGYKA